MGGVKMTEHLPPTETHLNQIINRSFQQHGFSCKIPDSGNKHLAKRPFDGFSVVKGNHYYWESKLLMKGEYFTFSDIKKHQYDSMDLITYNSGWSCAFYIIGIWDGDHMEVLFISHNHIKKLKKEGHKSLSPDDLTVLVSAYSLTAGGRVTKDYSNLVIQHIDQAVII